MRRTLQRVGLAVAVACSGLWLGAAAHAAPVVYTGELFADNGLPYNGSVEVSVALYGGMMGGAALWTSADMLEAVMGGVLSVELEDPGLDALLAANPTLWMEFTIEGETLEPRQQVGRVPFAVVAGDAMTLGGMAPGDFRPANAPIESSALPTDGIGPVSNYALNN